MLASLKHNLHHWLYEGLGHVPFVPLNLLLKPPAVAPVPPLETFDRAYLRLAPRIDPTTLAYQRHNVRQLQARCLQAEQALKQAHTHHTVNNLGFYGMGLFATYCGTYLFILPWTVLAALTLLPVIYGLVHLYDRVGASRQHLAEVAELLQREKGRLAEAQRQHTLSCDALAQAQAAAAAAPPAPAASTMPSLRGLFGRFAPRTASFAPMADATFEQLVAARDAVA